MSKTLLLADDSITIQKVVGITFANEDFKIVSVDNGEDAVTRAGTVKPDIILADVVMPKLDGYQVCEKVKADPSLRHIPVLLLTGAFKPFDENRSRQVGADGHIAKPFDSQTLIDKVKELVSRPAAPAVAPPAPAPLAPPPPATPVVPAAAVPAMPAAGRPGGAADPFATPLEKDTPRPASMDTTFGMGGFVTPRETERPAPPTVTPSVAMTPPVAAPFPMSPPVAAPAPTPDPGVESWADLNSLVSSLPAASAPAPGSGGPSPMELSMFEGLAGAEVPPTAPAAPKPELTPQSVPENIWDAPSPAAPAAPIAPAPPAAPSFPAFTAPSMGGFPTTPAAPAAPPPMPAFSFPTMAPPAPATATPTAAIPSFEPPAMEPPQSRPEPTPPAATTDFSFASPPPGQSGFDLGATDEPEVENPGFSSEPSFTPEPIAAPSPAPASPIAEMEAMQANLEWQSQPGPAGPADLAGLADPVRTPEVPRHEEMPPVRPQVQAAPTSSADAATRELIERIAWEILPDLAESIVRKEIERLKREKGL